MPSKSSQVKRFLDETPLASGVPPKACPHPLLPTQERREGLPHLLPPGVNVSANQDDELDHETFLMQIDQETKKCTFYSSTGGYWTLVTHGGIQATATQVSANTMFEMEWRGRRVALKASNGRYVCMKKNGQLAAISDFVGEHSACQGLGQGLSLPRDSTCPDTPSPPRAGPSLARGTAAVTESYLLVKITVLARETVRPLWECPFLRCREPPRPFLRCREPCQGRT